MYVFVFVAAIGALYFASLAVRQPRLGTIAAALVWLLYVVYEYFIANGTLCDANCNIRVDLLLILPLLLCVSLFALNAPGQWTRTGKVIVGIGLFLVGSMAATALYITLAETPAADKAAQAAPAADSANAAK